MKIAKIVGAILIALAIILFFAAPVGPLPGVFIGGADTPVPATWPDTSDLHEVQLQVGEGAPSRVVIIWVIQVDGTLHVVGSKSRSGWTSAIAQGGQVRLRMGDNTYDLRATPVTDGFEPILEAYVAKYEPDYPDIVASFPELDEAEESVAVFRLSAR